MGSKAMNKYDWSLSLSQASHLVWGTGNSCSKFITAYNW